MSSEPDKKSPNQFKKAVWEWGIILGIFGILYITGLHTEVIGGLQRVLLSTGILRPDTEVDPGETRKANYNMPLITLDGDRTSLSEFEGKTIFLNFWATWCPPCIAEMPNIQKLYDQLEDEEKVVFVMLSLDEDPEKARAYMDRKEFTMPVYFLAGRQPGVYNSTVVPTTYVISPEGDIVVEKRGMAKYNTDEFRNFLLSL
ncbi:MAG: TlpA family protein disulfide reductase [Balneolaceae bacterium]|nr:TlpA family protein disulfide reductase [Balneolaceae bacterium]MBO6545422.1 TlpA family protein disulfide reductase [Balneolaceae bacterium]MBO6646818.1 TlpA family protein disulfide reductase [Balneolaceae bacterium]